MAFAAPAVVLVTSLTLVDGMCSIRDPLRTLAPSRGYDVAVAVAILVTRAWVSTELVRELDERSHDRRGADTTQITPATPGAEGMGWIRTMQLVSFVASVACAFLVDAMVLTWTFAYDGMCDIGSLTVRDFCSVVDPGSMPAKSIYVTNTVMLAAMCVYLFKYTG